VDIGVNCDPATLRRIRRLRIALVFQQFGLLPWRTVRDNVGFGLELRGDPPTSAVASSTSNSSWSAKGATVAPPA